MVVRPIELHEELLFSMTPPNEHTSEGGRDDRGVPYHAESTLSSAEVLLKHDARPQAQRRTEQVPHFLTGWVGELHSFSLKPVHAVVLAVTCVAGAQPRTRRVPKGG